MLETHTNQAFLNGLVIELQRNVPVFRRRRRRFQYCVHGEVSDSLSTRMHVAQNQERLVWFLQCRVNARNFFNEARNMSRKSKSGTHLCFTSRMDGRMK